MLNCSSLLLFCFYLVVVSGFNVNVTHALKSLYQLQAQDIQGNTVSLEKYQGKVSLVVNVASYCGYTDEHYRHLVSLQRELAIEKEEPFTVLAFPCNQFGEQEPLGNSDIARWCAEEYSVNFPVFSKIDVSGREKHIVYRFLMSGTGQEPTWNFWKYLVDDEGRVVDAWGPRVTPFQIKDNILQAIANAKNKHQEL